MTVDEQWVEVADPPVRVRVLGAGAGPPVVLVPGISAPAATWAPLVPHLRGRRAVAVDLPGQGLSPNFTWSGPRSLRDLATTILTGLLDDLGIEQAVIVANSLGGLFSLWLAHDRPDRVAGLALLGEPATALPGSRGSWAMGLLNAPAVGRLFQAGMGLPSPRFVQRRVMSVALGAHAAHSCPGVFLDVHVGATRLPGNAACFRSLLGRVLDGRAPRPENELTDGELAAIGAPVLFVWGDDDTFLSPDAGRASVDKLPDARLVVVAGGHEPWLDDPEGCGKLVTEFLEEIS